MFKLACKKCKKKFVSKREVPLCKVCEKEVNKNKRAMAFRMTMGSIFNRKRGKD